jgi:hypothetical protein
MTRRIHPRFIISKHSSKVNEGGSFRSRSPVGPGVRSYTPIPASISNWKLDRIGNGSADAIAGTLDGMFDFSEHGTNHKLFLDPLTGRPID